MTPFIHWLPKLMRLWLILRRQLGNWPSARTIDEGMNVVESARLLTGKMLASLFPETGLVTERSLMLPQSYTAVFRGQAKTSP